MNPTLEQVADTLRKIVSDAGEASCCSRLTDSEFRRMIELVGSAQQLLEYIQPRIND